MCKIVRDRNVIFARLSRALSLSCSRSSVQKCVSAVVLRQLSEAKRKVKYIGGGSLHKRNHRARKILSRNSFSLSLSLSGYFRRNIIVVVIRATQRIKLPIHSSPPPVPPDTPGASLTPVKYLERVRTVQPCICIIYISIYIFIYSPVASRLNDVARIKHLHDSPFLPRLLLRTLLQPSDA